MSSKRSASNPLSSNVDSDHLMCFTRKIKDSMAKRISDHKIIYRSCIMWSTFIWVLIMRPISKNFGDQQIDDHHIACNQIDDKILPKLMKKTFKKIFKSKYFAIIWTNLFFDLALSNITLIALNLKCNDLLQKDFHKLLIFRNRLSGKFHTYLF